MREAQRDDGLLCRRVLRILIKLRLRNLGRKIRALELGAILLDARVLGERELAIETQVEILADGPVIFRREAEFVIRSPGPLAGQLRFQLDARARLLAF